MKISPILLFSCLAVMSTTFLTGCGFISAKKVRLTSDLADDAKKEEVPLPSDLADKVFTPVPDNRIPFITHAVMIPKSWTIDSRVTDIFQDTFSNKLKILTHAAPHVRQLKLDRAIAMAYMAHYLYKEMSPDMVALCLINSCFVTPKTSVFILPCAAVVQAMVTGANKQWLFNQGGSIIRSLGIAMVLGGLASLTHSYVNYMLGKNQYTVCMAIQKALFDANIFYNRALLRSTVYDLHSRSIEAQFFIPLNADLPRCRIIIARAPGSQAWTKKVRATEHFPCLRFEQRREGCISWSDPAMTSRIRKKFDRKLFFATSEASGYVESYPTEGHAFGDFGMPIPLRFEPEEEITTEDYILLRRSEECLVINMRVAAKKAFIHYIRFLLSTCLDTKTKNMSKETYETLKYFIPKPKFRYVIQNLVHFYGINIPSPTS
jgi:hypothetical protein